MADWIGFVRDDKTSVGHHERQADSRWRSEAHKEMRLRRSETLIRFGLASRGSMLACPPGITVGDHSSGVKAL